MKHIKDIDINNKRVFLRCDLNVPMDDNGNILDDFRIKRSLPTIKYLIENNAKIIIASHLSDVDRSIKPVLKTLIEYIGKDISFSKNFEINGDIVLLENLRMHKGEKENDIEFAKKLASLADVYVNDAFGVCHREHASVSEICKHIPSYAGFLLHEEVDNLSDLISEPERPLVAVIGGAKLGTKVGAIAKFLKVADHVLVGGNVANILLQGKGISMSGKLKDDELKEMIDEIDLTDTKLHLPVDAVTFIAGEKDYLRKTSIGSVREEEKIYDIGPETIKLYSEIIRTAKTIFFNGPLGLIEKDDYAYGTFEIGREIVESDSYCIAGGGESNDFFDDKGLLEKFDYVSTGGGAMLELVAGEKLPGLIALGYYD